MITERNIRLLRLDLLSLPSLTPDVMSRALSLVLRLNGAMHLFIETPPTGAAWMKFNTQNLLLCQTMVKFLIVIILHCRPFSSPLIHFVEICN